MLWNFGFKTFGIARKAFFDKLDHSYFPGLTVIGHRPVLVFRQFKAYAPEPDHFTLNFPFRLLCGFHILLQA